jgi:hypothetical protein
MIFQHDCGSMKIENILFTNIIWRMVGEGFGTIIKPVDYGQGQGINLNRGEIEEKNEGFT